MVQAQRAFVALDPAPYGEQADAVVRPIARAAERPCARPACPSPARATLRFAYDARQVVLESLATQREPQAYDLCASHAARTRPPHGWKLRDVRSDADRESDLATPLARPSDLGSQRTVAVLAAALRAVPAGVPEHDSGFSTPGIATTSAGDAAPGGGPLSRPATAAVDGPIGECDDPECGDGIVSSLAPTLPLAEREDLAMQGFAGTVGDDADDVAAATQAPLDTATEASREPARVVRVSSADGQHLGAAGFPTTW